MKASLPIDADINLQHVLVKDRVILKPVWNWMLYRAHPDWVDIHDLIKELQTFLEVADVHNKVLTDKDLDKVMLT